MWKPTRLALICFVAISCSSIVVACNVPVFRYALDHWRPDAYRAVVLHHGPLSEQSQSVLSSLQTEIENQRLNLTVKQIDAGKLADGELPDSLVSLDVSDTPQLLIYYPVDLDIREPIISTKLIESKANELLDSPLRRELRQRLAAGQSAVYLFVASGNEQLDNVARATLDSELRSLQSTLELPKLTDDPEDRIQGGPALRIEFSLLELTKEDVSEWAIRSMLLGSEPDLADLEEPLVFPVFGCGRALWPLVGAGINAENLKESATFVSGACSCQVKEQNPGFDLLLNAKWDELLPWTTGSESSHNLGQSVQVAETVPIPTGNNMSKELLAMGLGSATLGEPAPSTATEAASSGSMTIILIAVVALAVIVALAFLMSKSKRAFAGANEAK